MSGEWVFVLWVAINSGSLTQARMTGEQCAAAIAEIEETIDPLMAWCVGPKGERLRTSDVVARRRKRLGALTPPPDALPPAAPPVAGPRVSGGIGL